MSFSTVGQSPEAVYIRIGLATQHGSKPDDLSLIPKIRIKIGETLLHTVVL